MIRMFIPCMTLALAACSGEESSKTQTEEQQFAASSADEAAAAEAIDEEEWGFSPPDCDPPLALSPEDSFIAPSAPLLYYATGGTGNYHFSLAELTDDVYIDAETGLFASFNVAGTYTVQLEDSQCAGSASTSITVTEGLSVLPAAATMLPETTIEMDILGHSGDVACAFELNESGATLNDCVYTAGSGEGVDALRIVDSNTAESVLVTYAVTQDAAINLRGQHYVLPVGESRTLSPAGGSGHLDITGFDSAMVTTSDSAISTLTEGTSTALVTDRYTGMTANIRIDAIPLHTNTGTINVSNGHPVSSYTVVSPGDVNGDGQDDAFVSFPGHHYEGVNSGLVALYSSDENGFLSEPLQILSEYYDSDPQADDQFGKSITTGDFDQNGLIDVAIGARYADRIYVYYNTGDPSQPYPVDPSTTLSNGIQPGSGDQFGFSAASCDVNGDGWLDIIGGAANHTAAVATSSGYDYYNGSGAIRVYLGGPSGFDPDDFVQRVGVTPDADGSWNITAGLSIGSLLGTGDFNGDGLCDVVTNGTQTSLTNPGHKVWLQVYLGTEDGIGQHPAKLFSHVTYSSGKESVSGVTGGDLDGDGVDELFATWRTTNDSATPIHQVSLAMFQHLDFTIDPTAPVIWDKNVWELEHDQVHEIGTWNSIEDFNGDGQNDLVFSGWSHNKPTVLVISGTDILDDTYPGYGLSNYTPWSNTDLSDYLWAYQFVTQTDNSNSSKGRVYGLHTVTDKDQDGLKEIVMVKSEDWTAGNSIEHAFYITSGQQNTPLDYPGLAGGFLIGSGLTLFDTDGDGTKELLAGAPNMNEGGYKKGELIAYSWENGYYSSTGNVLSFERPYDFSRFTDSLGRKISADSDFDGDGYKDLAFTIGYTRASHVKLIIHRGTATGLAEEPSCIVDINERFDNGYFPYEGRLLGGTDLNQDGKDDYIVSGHFFNGEYGGVNIIYGQDLSDNGDGVSCEFDTEIQSWQYGTGLGKDLTIGYIDDDSCPDLVLPEPEMTTDEPRSGALHILWGSGTGCRSEAEISSFYYPLGYNNIGFSVTSGVDLNDDGYDEVVLGNGYYDDYMAFVLDGQRLAEAPSQAFDGSVTQAGPLYEEVDHFYDRLSEYVTSAPLPLPEKCSMQLFADSSNAKWLALGCKDHNEVQVFAYDSNAASFAKYPHIVVGSDSNNQNWKGDFGAFMDIQQADGKPKLLMGAPTSNRLGPSIGAAMVLDLE